MVILLYANYKEKNAGSSEKIFVSKGLLKEVVDAEVNTALLQRAPTDRIENTKQFLDVKKLPSSQKLRILVTGGAGFVGSHLVDRLMMQVVI